MLDNLRSATFDFFRKETNPQNGLIADKTQPGSPSSIAAVGMALSVYIVAVERGWFSRKDAIDRTLTLLRFFHASHQGRKRMPPDTKGSTITSSTCRPAAGSGNANCRRSIPPY